MMTSTEDADDDDDLLRLACLNMPTQKRCVVCLFSRFKRIKFIKKNSFIT